MLHVHGIHQKAKRIPSGWQGTLRNAQGGNKETMNTANTGNTVNGLWQPVCHVLWNFDSTGLCVLLAGKAHCAKPILRAKNVGQVGQVGLVGRLALGCVCAMCSGNSKVPGSLYLPSLCTLLQPDKSVILTNLQHPYPVGGDTHFQRVCFTKITASPGITDPILPA